MKAGEVVFQDLVNGNLQYQVPLFQRTYSWSQDHWEKLWEDIIDVYMQREPRPHFLGAIVTLPIPDSPEHAQKFMLIDGQQRLTTLFVLLSAIRDRARTSEITSRTAEQIDQTCLMNSFALREDERIKLKPTQRDVEALRSAVLSLPHNDGTSQIPNAYRYFADALGKGDEVEQNLDLSRLLLVVTKYLCLVSVRLDQEDSPHRIFESLNTRGARLTAADLVRNHVFMQIKQPAFQAVAYKEHWYPMETRLEVNGESLLTDFFWRFLMSQGDLPRYDEVFVSMKSWIDKQTPTSSVIGVLSELNKHSGYYLKLRQPVQSVTDSALAGGLRRLNLWEAEVTYPFMLSTLAAVDDGRLSAEILVPVLSMIESFLVRRYICGVPTNRLRRIFAVMATQVDERDFLQSCRAYLHKNNWPTDEVFGQAFQTATIYNLGRLTRTRIILDALEESFDHQEPVQMSDQITIEHIMPQQLSEVWESELGPDFQTIHDTYLHTIGNLTYSGYNTVMGNKPFEEKRAVLSRSHFELNRDIISEENWDREAIRRRAERLAARATKIWAR